MTFPPSVYEIEQYWGDILETEVRHNESVYWLRRQINSEANQTVEQQWSPILGALGLKRIGNLIWMKRITCLYGDLTCNYNLLFQDPDSVPDLLSQRTTTFIPRMTRLTRPKLPAYHVFICL